MDTALAATAVVVCTLNVGVGVQPAKNSVAADVD